MSEEKQYVEITFKIPDELEEAKNVKAWGDSFCRALSVSPYDDDFVNNDIIVNYDDTPGEVYMAISVEFINNNGLDGLELIANTCM